jgi:hypothetical protein
MGEQTLEEPQPERPTEMEEDSRGRAVEEGRAGVKGNERKEAQPLRRYGHVYFPEDYKLSKAKGARLFGFFLPTRMEFETLQGKLKWSSRAHRSVTPSPL